MLVLGIESSCDETAIAIVNQKFEVLSNVIASQILDHQKTMGVVPETAARLHVSKFDPVLKKALNEAGVTMKDIDLITVSNRPGLIGCLVTGCTFASTLGLIHNIPVVGVNHKLGHVYSCLLDLKEEIEFPVVVLSVSGGHNELYLINSLNEYKELGKTLDDAAGECYDKVAKMLGLKYPGGPEISRLAEFGDSKSIKFPDPLPHQKMNFSFSGLKTNVKNKIQEFAENGNLESNKANIASSFQYAINHNLSKKLLYAATQFNSKEVHLVGGVSANKNLRSMILEKIQKKNLKIKFRHPLNFNFCTDNAAMIALLGHLKLDNQKAQNVIIPQ